MNLKPTTIPRKQLAQRWDVLPSELREALTDERNSEILWKLCTGEHLSEEKTCEVARIVAWVLMGFLHPADVANEVKLSIDIHPELAATIANALNAKIFAPMREELEGTYAPPGTEPHYAPQEEIPSQPAFVETTAGEPAVLEDIRNPEAMDETLQKIRGGGTGEPFFKESPVSLDSLKFEGGKVEVKETPPMPAFDLSSFAPPPPPPSPSTLNLEPSTSPFILHEEAPAPSLSQVGDFSLDIKPEEFGPSQPEFRVSPQANIEIGGTQELDLETKTLNLKPKTSSEEPRTVHYGDLRTPISAEGEISPLWGGEPATPHTPFSTLTEPENVIAFSDPDKEPEAPPAPPIPAVMPESDVSAQAPRKTGFFARLFGKKAPLAAPTAEEIPMPPPSVAEATFGGQSPLQEAAKETSSSPVLTDAAPLPELPPPPNALPQDSIKVEPSGNSQGSTLETQIPSDSFINISSFEGKGGEDSPLKPKI